MIVEALARRQSSCPINGERLWQSIMAIAEFGRLPGGGCARLSLSDEDRAARCLFVQWCRQAGCEVNVDPFGNIFAIRSGRDAALPAVLVGSHLDTQPHGGRFDGVYGVMAGLEIVRALNDAGIETEAPVVIVNWTNEEGVRFAPGLTGSSAFAGMIDREEVLGIVGHDGASFGAELLRIGFAGQITAERMAIAAYVEPHIEQGPLLEKLGMPIGIVTGVQGVRWFRVSVVGADRHAGTTSMQMRQDSFMATSRLALEMRKCALDASPDIRFTVGRIEVRPGSPNTIPGLTTFTIDLRHDDRKVLDLVEAGLHRLAGEIGASEGVRIDVEQTMDVKPVSFDCRIVDVLSQSALALGFPFERLVSGAMHDASNVALIAPTAMLFVPCRDGISHAEEEWAEPEHLSAGCQVLVDSVIQLARGSFAQ
jgi:beta-ureidopropionase / N-carbamoyl-L-amino-acid hydrolase